jgi:hypothetical protein
MDGSEAGEGGITMGIAIAFEWDSRDLAVWRKRSLESALERALSKSGSDAVRALKAESNRRVRTKKRFKVAFLNKSLPVTYPTSKEISRLAWRMDVSGALVPVAAFPHRQTKKGVSVAINVSSRKTIRSAFIATMRSGHEGVFVRRGKKHLPIREAFTTRVSDVFMDSGFIPIVQTKAQGVFAQAFERLLKIELQKGRG